MNELNVHDPPLDYLSLGHGAVHAYLAHAPGASYQYDELLSDALSGVQTSLNSWTSEGGTTLAGWIGTHMRWSIIDGLRKRGILNRRELNDHVQLRDLPADRQTPLSMSLWTHPESDERSRNEPSDPAANVAEDAVDDHLLVLSLLRLLTDRQRRVIERCDFNDESLRSIAKSMGVTESRISQIRRTAYERMRNGIPGNQSKPTSSRQRRRLLPPSTPIDGWGIVIG